MFRITIPRGILQTIVRATRIKAMVVGYQPIADDSKNVVQPKTYFGRFYVLAVFSFMAAHQNTTWITFGTIPQESFDYFGLTDDDITLIAG